MEIFPGNNFQGSFQVANVSSDHPLQKIIPLLVYLQYPYCSFGPKLLVNSRTALVMYWVISILIPRKKWISSKKVLIIWMSNQSDENDRSFVQIRKIIFIQNKVWNVPSDKNENLPLTTSPAIKIRKIIFSICSFQFFRFLIFYFSIFFLFSVEWKAK